MNARVSKLRSRSLEAVPHISTERAELITEFYASDRTVSPALRRARAFRCLMENKTIYIGDGELIVGERGPAPKAAPTYPELCCHSLQDLETLHNREKIPFARSPEALKVYEEKIIPFWKGRSMRDLIFCEMTDEWKAAYEAGIFTEFMEQRAPGHTVADDKIYRKGFKQFRAEIAASLAALDYSIDPEAQSKSEQLRAMDICADAICVFARRHAQLAREMAEQVRQAGQAGRAERADSASDRAAELLRIAEVCSWVPENPPRDFWEALQAYWFVHLGVITELNTWDSFNPGRLDQHLYPFYEQGLADGTLTRDGARELLQCFWIKFNNQPAPPKVGVTAAESGTYTDFANINSGGLTPDGQDGVNDVTYLVLDVVDEMRLLQPSSNIQLSAKNPDRFLKRALRIVRQGWGQPSIFNADMVVQEMLRVGKSLFDARAGGTSGCVETGAFGKEAYILSGYFNLPKVLELALHNGIDARTGEQLGPRTGDATRFSSFDQLMEAFRKQLHHFIEIKVRGNNVIERLYAKYMPAPFLSLLIDDCIARGRDYHDGGARYNTTYVQGVGIGSITDSLSAIKRHVFDERRVDMGQLLAALGADFVGHERLRAALRDETPRYGNDDERADEIMKSVFCAFFDEVDGRPNTRGGCYCIDMLPTTCHVYFGSITQATPDGRGAGEPVSEGISPVQGADRRGPTAVLNSAARMDHALTGGTLLNMKFAPRLLEGEEGIASLAHLVRTYFKLGGHHIQFNVVSAETLLDAQAHPENHRDLIVRVAGYSDYFCDLSRALQDEIITRTEHESF
ncbi:MAG TPA: formate C-acetyltransferase/glycerol dehydratase family glycyl radical enzyme [Firmicutes bacterium]|nr:formate C-acetyltransferase/glycerol dehydratase family glycyl radical enzyme [Bacillota bacterium]